MKRTNVYDSALVKDNTINQRPGSIQTVNSGMHMYEAWQDWRKSRVVAPLGLWYLLLTSQRDAIVWIRNTVQNRRS